MKHYSMEEIRSSLSVAKNKGDSLWVQYVVRKISFPVTYVLINAGLSAWAVSVLSVFVAFAGCFLLCINSEVARWSAVLLIHMWMILDCVDGNIARVKKTQGPMGEFIDAQSGYVISAFCYLCIGVAAYYTAAANSVIYIFLGAVASIANILTRLIHQKYLVCVNSMAHTVDAKSNREQADSLFQKIRRRVGKELGLSGMFMILVIVCQLFSLYTWVCGFYTIFCLVSLFVVILRYSIKARV